MRAVAQMSGEKRLLGGGCAIALSGVRPKAQPSAISQQPSSVAQRVASCDHNPSGDQVIVRTQSSNTAVVDHSNSRRRAVVPGRCGGDNNHQP